MIITIDGPAGAGKSTVALLVARKLNLGYLNSGYIYRAVTLLVLERGGGFDDRKLVEEVIAGLDLRFEDPGNASATRVFQGDREVTDELVRPEVTAEVHRVANDGGYRRRLVDFQRRFAASGGLVAEGRDMGTVIFPEADLKVYLDASPEERARRRHRELLARAGAAPSYDEVLEGIVLRDGHDRGREDAPLRIPDDALVIPTDDLSASDVADRVLELAARDGTGTGIKTTDDNGHGR